MSIKSYLLRFSGAGKLIVFIAFVSLFSRGVYAGDSLQEKTKDGHSELTTLLAAAIRHGFPNFKEAVTFSGEIVVKSLIQQGDHSLSTPVASGRASPTRSDAANIEEDGRLYRSQHYQGLARRLGNGVWLFGDCEWVFPSESVTVNSALALALHGYPLVGPTLNYDDSLLSHMETFILEMRDIVGDESENILHLLRRNRGKIDTSFIEEPYKVLYSLGYSDPLFNFSTLDLLDTHRRIVESSLSAYEPPLDIDGRDADRLDEIGDNGSHSPNGQEYGEFLKQKRLKKDYKWNRSASPSVSLVRNLLCKWFMYASNLRPESISAALQEMGYEDEFRDTQISSGDKAGLQSIDLSKSVSQRLSSWIPSPLNSEMDQDERASRIRNKNAIKYQKMLDEEEPIIGDGNEFATSQSDEIVGVQSLDGALFAKDDLDALFNLLEDLSPSSWQNKDTRKPWLISDCALRGIAEVLDFDPRYLLGVSPRVAWTEKMRIETIAGLRSWWRQSRQKPISEAISDCVYNLSSRNCLSLILRLPQPHKGEVCKAFMVKNLTSPIDVRGFSSVSIARLVRAFYDSGNGEAFSLTLDFSLLDPILWVMKEKLAGRSLAADALLEKRLFASPEALPNALTDESALIRKLIVAIADKPVAGTIAKTRDWLSGSLENAALQQILVSLMFRSAWTDGLDALISTSTESRGKPYQAALGFPSAFYWTLWYHMLHDERALPKGVRAALSVDNEGNLTIEHLGGSYSDRLLIDTYDGQIQSVIERNKEELANDLRVCDLLAWALVQQESSWLFPDRKNDLPIRNSCIIQLGGSKQERNAPLARLREIMRRHFDQYNLAPLAPSSDLFQENGGL